MKNITVIGAGTMGNGIAHVFAMKGFKVNLVDVSEPALQKAIQTISGNLDRMVAKEKLTAADKENTLANLSTFTNFEHSANADLVVE
ncbi:MAG: 3-hydroxyacyl-CoA dehydrogenase NAD-binding domain-containing protein, partial [Chitinophagales bacterium]